MTPSIYQLTNGENILMPILDYTSEITPFIELRLWDDTDIPMIAKMANRMKEYGILMSSDGIDKNVIKVKPPLIFTKKNSNTLMFFLRKVLKEDVMKIQL